VQLLADHAAPAASNLDHRPGGKLWRMDELLQASAVAQAAAIREGRVSSEELVRAQLGRIAAVNPALNAVVQVNGSALAQARTADEARARGAELGAFHGVPFTAKDWIETHDLICAAGLIGRAAYVPKRDATVVTRMRAAGAILLGKTNVQEANEVYGATRNPYDLARSPGASSSGEAAIVAAWASALGLGSDSGGSLRYPAHCCGVATLKPTTGRVPNTGHFPRIGASHDPRTVIGPVSRHVEDLWPALNVIAGVDWRDPSVAPVPLLAAREGVAGRRMGCFVEMPGTSPSGATTQTVRAAAAALGAAGADVEEVALPRIDEAMPLTEALSHRPSWRPGGAIQMLLGVDAPVANRASRVRPGRPTPSAQRRDRYGTLSTIPRPPSSSTRSTRSAAGAPRWRLRRSRSSTRSAASSASDRRLRDATLHGLNMSGSYVARYSTTCPSFPQTRYRHGAGLWFVTTTPFSSANGPQRVRRCQSLDDPGVHW